jgi:hypothetical protein
MTKNSSMDMMVAIKEAEKTGGGMCCRCYDIVPKLYPSNCDHDPVALRGEPIGTYHCPSCGSPILAGVKHPPMCILCIKREHPKFDRPKE